MEESNYAAATLAKNQITIDRAQRRTMPMACVRYCGCVVGLSLSAVLRGEREGDELQKGSFLWNSLCFGFNSYVEPDIILCMYVDDTKCLRPPNRKSNL